MRRALGRNRKLVLQIVFGIALLAVLIVSAWVAWGPGYSSDQGGVGYRVFSHIAIMVDGVNMTIPGNIGVPGGMWANHTLDGLGVSGYAPIYTQTESGVIYVEATKVYPFVLGDFFNIWGQTLTDTPQRCILNYCQSGTTTITLFVNGDPPSNPDASWRAIVLFSQTDIFFRISTPNASK